MHVLKNIFVNIFIVCCLISTTNSLFASSNSDTVKLNYGGIYGEALKGKIRPALALLQVDTTKIISAKDRSFIKNFEKRFKYNEDKSSYLDERKSKIDTLIKIFRDYWRLSLEDDSHNYDTLLTTNLSGFFTRHYHLTGMAKQMNSDTLDHYITRYTHSFGLYTSGFGRVGRYYDLLVWRVQKDTSYKFSVLRETIVAPVVFMDDFVSLGWEDYATLGVNYPGGWTTHDAIYCVKKAYDLKSDDFLIGLLAHEGRHFADYTLFPKLAGADLEYRAKLVELSLYKDSIYQYIQFFINEADGTNNKNPHPFADYRLIRDLSKLFFNVEFEKDMTKWKSLSYQKINEAAIGLLKQNTAALQANQVLKN